MKRTESRSFFAFLIFLILFGMLTAALAAPQLSRSKNAPADMPLPTERIRCVVLDAGHGGEDGGAVGKGGAVEKEINLGITFLLRDLLVANGIEVILTRDRDVLLYDRDVDYRGRKKVLDLAARRKIAETHPDACFVSIHMNTHPIASCRGLQVWYSKNDGRSKVLAEAIQETARESIDPQNHRTPKEAGSSIYLLHRLTTPAVLVECGFLSNAEEEALLATEGYQKKVALSIFLAIVRAELDQKEA